MIDISEISWVKLIEDILIIYVYKKNWKQITVLIINILEEGQRTM